LGRFFKSFPDHTQILSGPACLETPASRRLNRTSSSADESIGSARNQYQLGGLCRSPALPASDRRACGRLNDGDGPAGRTADLQLVVAIAPGGSDGQGSERPDSCSPDATPGRCVRPPDPTGP